MSTDPVDPLPENQVDERNRIPSLRSIRKLTLRWSDAIRNVLHPWLSHWMVPKPSPNGESIGAKGERLAADYLSKRRYRILFRSWRCPMGEIDLIALDRNRKPDVLVFVEVKAWSSPGEGGPSDAVNLQKQQRLTRLALSFLKQKKLLDRPARFDVVEVILQPPSIRHFENAFEPVGQFQWYA